MRYREFGDTGMVVSEIGFGCSRIGGMFTKGDASDPIALLRLALEAGITFFDTADTIPRERASHWWGGRSRADATNW